MKLRPEDLLQESIVDFVRTVAPQVLVFAIPNGFNRTVPERMLASRTGLVAGIPDLGLMLPGGGVAFIEIKTASGSLSKAQEAIRDRMIELGTPHLVARSLDDVRAALRHWNVTSREAP